MVLAGRPRRALRRVRGCSWGLGGWGGRGLGLEHPFVLQGVLLLVAVAGDPAREDGGIDGEDPGEEVGSDYVDQEEPAHGQEGLITAEGMGHRDNDPLEEA